MLEVASQGVITCTPSLTFAKRVFHPGDDVEGVARVHVDERWRGCRVVLELFCLDDVFLGHELYAGDVEPGAPLELPFALPLGPEAPCSYAGKHVTVSWRAVLRVELRAAFDEEVEAGFEVAPRERAGRTVRVVELPAAPALNIGAPERPVLIPAVRDRARPRSLMPDLGLPGCGASLLLIAVLGVLLRPLLGATWAGGLTGLVLSWLIGRAGRRPRAVSALLRAIDVACTPAGDALEVRVALAPGAPIAGSVTVELHVVEMTPSEQLVFERRVELHRVELPGVDENARAPFVGRIPLEGAPPQSVPRSSEGVGISWQLRLDVLFAKSPPLSERVELDVRPG